MSARSWFSINTTTNWSKLPVASGDRCPGGAVVTRPPIGRSPDPRSATTTRTIEIRTAPRARFISALARISRESLRNRPRADADDPRGESGHQREGRLLTWVAAICRLGARYRKWLLQWETGSWTRVGKWGASTDPTTRFLPLLPLRISASESGPSGASAGAGGDRDRSRRSSRPRGPPRTRGRATRSRGEALGGTRRRMNRRRNVPSSSTGGPHCRTPSPARRGDRWTGDE